MKSYKEPHLWQLNKQLILMSWEEGCLDPRPQPSSSKKYQVYVEQNLETAPLNGRVCSDSRGKIPAAILTSNFESMAT